MGLMALTYRFPPVGDGANGPRVVRGGWGVRPPVGQGDRVQSTIIGGGASDRVWFTFNRVV